MKTRKQISEDVKTSKIEENYGIRFFHEYTDYDTDIKYSVSTFPRVHKVDSIEDSLGRAHVYCYTKKEFVNFLFELQK